jgi:hypothetical protein
MGPTGQPHPKADRWGPRSGRVKEKEKGYGSVLGPKGVGPAQGPTRLGWLHGSARPAAQQAGSVLGLARRVGRLGLTGQPTAHHSPSHSNKTGPGATRRRRKGKKGAAVRRLVTERSPAQQSGGERCGARREAEDEGPRRRARPAGPAVACGCAARRRKERGRWARPCASGPCLAGKKRREVGWLGLSAQGGFISLAFEFEFEWPIQI